MNKETKSGYALMVTCVGAYDDSGVGTGGFAFVRDGQAMIIDKLDSTGLFVHGDMVYRFIRQMKAIVGYSANGIHSFLKVPAAKDVHDLRLTQDGFLCVSTGHNEIVWFSPFGKTIRTWHADGTGTDDAWHLNCVEDVNGQLYASAFGEFKTHREWNGRTHQTGFIMDLQTGRKIIENLTGPHNPRYLDGKWLVCESHLRLLTIISSDGVAQRIQLEGFTRGLTYNEKFVFVGESANRKAENVSEHSHIVVMDRETFQILDRIRVPFSEIYDIVIIPSGISISPDNLSTFQFNFGNDRIAFLEEQLERLRIELLKRKRSIGIIAGVKKKLQKLIVRFSHVR